MAINGIALVIALWVFQTYHHNRSPLEFALISALAGVAALPVVAWKRFRLIDFGNAEKPSLAFAFYTVLTAIGAHAVEDQTLLDRSIGLWVAVMVGLALGALILWFELPVKAIWAFIATALLIFAAWGIIPIANCLLDQEPGYAMQTSIGDQGFTVPVCATGGRFSSGGCMGRFSQYVILSPALSGLPVQLSIDMGWYKRARTGDKICVVKHVGRFGARWFSFRPCPAT